MALELELTLKNNHVSKYWKITKFEIDKYRENVNVYILLFNDKATSDAKGSWDVVRHYIFKKDDYTDFLGVVDLFGLAYTKIKLLKNIDVNPSWAVVGSENDLVWEGSIDV